LNKVLLWRNSLSLNRSTAYLLLFSVYVIRLLFWNNPCLEFTLQKKKIYKKCVFIRKVFKTGRIPFTALSIYLWDPQTGIDCHTTLTEI